MKSPTNNNPVIQDSDGNYHSYSDEFQEHIVWDDIKERWIPMYHGCMCHMKNHSIMERQWKEATTPPKEGGRFWGYVAFQGDLGLSYYQDNVSYNETENRWSSNNIKKEGGTVTHWTELLDSPEK